jgi:hypothetical protein
MKKSNLIHIQTKNNLAILTHKINTLITLTNFLKNVKNTKKELIYRDGGSNPFQGKNSIIIIHEFDRLFIYNQLFLICVNSILRFSQKRSYPIIL